MWGGMTAGESIVTADARPPGAVFISRSRPVPLRQSCTRPWSAGVGRGSALASLVKMDLARQLG